MGYTDRANKLEMMFPLFCANWRRWHMFSNLSAGKLWRKLFPTLSYFPHKFSIIVERKFITSKAPLIYEQGEIQLKLFEGKNSIKITEFHFPRD